MEWRSLHIAIKLSLHQSGFLRLESSQQFVNYIPYHRRQLSHKYSHLGCDNSVLRRWFNAPSSSPLERGNVYAVGSRRPLNTVEDKRVDNTAICFRFDACVDTSITNNAYIIQVALMSKAAQYPMKSERDTRRFWYTRHSIIVDIGVVIKALIFLEA